MLPVRTSKSTGGKPGGTQDWRTTILARLPMPEDVLNQMPPSRFHEYILPKRSGLPYGTRLTPDRIGMLKMGEELWEAEREMLLEILYSREAVLTFEWEEIGRVREEVTPPIKIRTVPHEPWMAKGVPYSQISGAHSHRDCPTANECETVGRLPRSISEFLLPGFERKWEISFDQAAVFLNKVSIKDANLPPSADEFSEEFSGMAITSVVDLFSGYDQVPLAEESRDMTAFQTLIGLLRMTTLPQGWTNSVPEFVRIVKKVLADCIPHDCDVYLDDIPVKGPRTRYKEQETIPGVRRFVFEHLQKLDRTLFNLETAGLTISPLKSQFCVPAIKVVGYVCDIEGRHPETAKVIKILDGPLVLTPMRLVPLLELWCIIDNGSEILPSLPLLYTDCYRKTPNLYGKESNKMQWIVLKWR